MLKALPNPRSSDTDTLSRVERKHAERELRHLNKEIDLVRALMYKNYERVRSLMDPGVYLTSCHLDKLLVRRQQLEQLTDKPPPVALLHCSLVVEVVRKGSRTLLRIASSAGKNAPSRTQNVRSVRIFVSFLALRGILP